MSQPSARWLHAHGALLPLAVVALGLALGCGGVGTGCTSLAPFPGGARFSGPKDGSSVNLRISQDGLASFNRNWQQLVAAFAPGGTLHVPVGCSQQSFNTGLPLIGVQTFYLADQGGPGGGRNDGVCDARDLPADVAVTITGFSLAPAGGTLEATLSVAVSTGKIYFTSPGSVFCALTCSLGFDDTAAPSTVTAALRLSIDPRWDQLLAISLQSLGGTQVCGAAGAPAAPGCLDPNRLAISSEPGPGGFCIPASWACDVLGAGFIKDLLLQLISPTLQSALQGLVSGQTCQPCGAGQPACPGSTDGSALVSVCGGAGQCLDPSPGGACVPRFLGTEGRLDLGALLGSVGAPPAEVELSLAAGSAVAVDTGLTLGTRVGVQPSQVATCVPPLPAPTSAPAPAPDFDGQAPTPQGADGGYQVALSLSAGFLNRFLWSAHQAGALCLSLGSGSVSLLNTGVLKSFLPSLGTLASVDGQDAPMQVLLRPALAPEVVVGKGTFDPVTHQPLEPLLTVTLKDLALDFYALIAERQVRVFTLTVDLALPLSLVFEGCDQLTPALGDLGTAISNIRASNSELLAEDPAALGSLVPAVVSLAQPAIAQALSSVTLPAVAGFRLRGDQARGLTELAGTGTYAHLGLYATLAPLGGACAVTAPRLTARLASLDVPTLDQVRASTAAAPALPAALLEVAVLDKAGTPELSVRVDDGLWSDFAPAPAGLLRVAQPRLLWQGPHTLWVRARVAEDPAGLSAPAAVPVVIDYEAPRVELAADRAHDRLLVRAADAVTPARALTYAYRVGTGTTSAFGPSREIALSAVEAEGGVTVQVRDEQGHVGQATYPPAPAGEAAALPQALPLPAEAQLPLPLQPGCSVAGGWQLLLAAAVLVAARRRR
jgi:hypothetical protein